MAKTTAKLFMHGRSQAVRLPKEFRMAGKEVEISRKGDVVAMKAVGKTPLTKADWDKYWAELDALGPTEGLYTEGWRQQNDVSSEPKVDFD